MVSPQSITRMLHSRGAAVALALLAIAAAGVFLALCELNPSDESSSPLDFGAAAAALPVLADYMLAMLANAGVAALLLFINRKFNILRSNTSLFAGLFVLMQLATPDIFCHFGLGMLLCVAVVCAMAVIFGCYDDSQATLGVFTIFLILSTGTMLQYAFAAYIPVFLLACAQMRIMSVRTVLAALLGLVVPWWLLFGFGLYDPEALRAPRFAGLFSLIDLHDAMHLAVTVGVTVLFMVATLALNMFKTIAYNARTRSVNGVVLVVSFVTLLVMLIDFTHLPVYVPLLNCCGALAIAHYFSAHESQRSYVGILVVIIAYILLFVWRTMI